jgi:hypothetical protein
MINERRGGVVPVQFAIQSYPGHAPKYFRSGNASAAGKL